jgi:hypothetical protein
MGAVRDYLSQIFPATEIEQVGIAGFTLYSAVQESLSFASQSPSVLLEDGTRVEDHIINEPKQITIQGVIGDRFIEPKTFDGFVSEITGGVGFIAGLLPPKTAASLQKINAIADDINDAIDQADRIIETGKQISSVFGFGSGAFESIKQQFLNTIIRIRDSKQLITIETSLGVYRDMAISSFEPSKDNESGELVFTLTATQLRFRKIELTEVRFAPSDALNGQVSQKQNKGAQQPEDQPEKSLLSSIFG